MKTVFSLIIALFSLGIRAQSNSNPYNLVLEKYIDTYLNEYKGFELDVIYVLEKEIITNNLKQTIVSGGRNISIKIISTKQLLNGNINSVWEIMPIQLLDSNLVMDIMISGVEIKNRKVNLVNSGTGERYILEYDCDNKVYFIK